MQCLRHRLLQRAVLGGVLAAWMLVSVARPAWADPALQAAQAAHAEGLAAGQAVQSTVRDSLTTPRASEVVPGYTAAPPERAYFGQPLSGASEARRAACLLSPHDPMCQALLGAQASAQTPRPAVPAYDPAVLGAARIAGNPAAVLEDIGQFYSGCQVDTVVTAATEPRTCRQYSGATPQSCDRTLAVEVARTSSCAPGDWLAQATSGALALAVQCKPDAAAARLRLMERGTVLAYLDVDLDRLSTSPEPVHTLPDGRKVWIADRACQGQDCSLTAHIAVPSRQVCTSVGDGPEVCRDEPPFLPRYAACPAGTLSGDRILQPPGDGATPPDGPATLDAGRCWAPSRTPADGFGQDGAGGSSWRHWRIAGPRAVLGHQPNPRFGRIPTIALRFDRPHTTVKETDRWTDQCPAALGTGRCTVATAARCVEGPATRQVDGAPVTRACWRYATDLSCAFGRANDECAPLAAAGCTPSTSVCRDLDPATGTCRVTEQTYACPVASTTSATARNCPTDVFCIAGSCFDTRHPADTDFARSMAFLEAAREAGVYLDTDRLQVFKGEPNRCRDRLLKNCCMTDGAGRGMHNQSVFGVGSQLVYDVLMNAGNREFLYQGMQALLLSGGFSGSFTSYGVTVAINGTALPAGSAVLYAGESMVVAFDPWSLVIAIVLYVVMSAMACDAEEGKLAMKEGARLCHAVGTYCSSCIRVLGRCVSCITHTTNKCCFNSALARIVQEQGRQQLGKGWGTARNPDCSGFTVAQLQRLDFARMDLSEFYASIVPTLPNAGTIQGRQVQRAAGCYYGEGQCP
ncbi:type-F conjugative transfer system mating-pair stabilization protein TraN [Pseudorhodoferax sp. Leaf267]|uniref:type-F conjugative transfer system mating-pair stabilization protein TraN n=1 Tax=Pseudorhodoferax sp. Leaf267 TaxID=1736316 RepID=UPI0006F1E52F|nr:type-F conjugative transfer system mating-pair stabilization protein TraN [Pseudorhodoferax sp. Leaf267]KQP23395.1 conjugal transfer protein TraN [Pseudorhodoferax sp. Leaf267]